MCVSSEDGSCVLGRGRCQLSYLNSSPAKNRHQPPTTTIGYVPGDNRDSNQLIPGPSTAGRRKTTSAAPPTDLSGHFPRKCLAGTRPARDTAAAPPSTTKSKKGLAAKAPSGPDLRHQSRKCLPGQSSAKRSNPASPSLLSPPPPKKREELPALMEIYTGYDQPEEQSKPGL